MTLGIMQPYIFPYLGYFQLLNAVDEYVVYDDVQFIKGGWINRNNILVNGQKNLFSFALTDASSNKKINEIEIKDDFKKFFATLDNAYAKAPYREEVLALLKNICDYEDKNLARFIANSLKHIANDLQIETKMIISSDLKKDVSLKGQQKVIAICHELEADTYINAIGGMELYSKHDFEAEGIDLKFLQPILPEYKQLKNDFVPGLSIVDVLMFNSPHEVKKMLSMYNLK